MARYTGPACKLARREQVDLGLKHRGGYRTFEQKCRADKLPGQKVASRRPRVTVYGRLLREKQKLRRTYGVMEKQFRRHFTEASRRQGSTGVNLLQILESRLDNVVYRMGFGATRAESRQLVNHNAIEVNNKRVNIPSFEVRPGDIVQVREKSREQVRVKESLDITERNGFPTWIEVDVDNFRGVYKNLPERDEITEDINETLVIGYYSK
ncbi:MAG: 30S ribosomal protein S4 [Acidiferrobacterales bacterium]|nr:30S ribosomal protein S4 [Acidiferrobacterales bacterium]